MKRVWLAIPVLAVLAACSTTRPDAPDAGLTTSAPVPVAGLDWHLSEDARETKLAYGRANSDDLRLALTCVPGSGTLGLLQTTVKPGSEIHLESGGDTERFAARVEPAGVHEGDLLFAEARTDASVFQRFRRLGWLASWDGGTREVMVAHPASTAAVDRFFAVCG